MSKSINPKSRFLKLSTALLLWQLTVPVAIAQSTLPAPPASNTSTDGPADANDIYYAEETADQRQDKKKRLRFILDKAEIRFNDDGGQVGAWDYEVWYGGKVNQVRFETDGNYNFDNDAVNKSSIKILWNRRVLPDLDIRFGPKYTLQPRGQLSGNLIFAGHVGNDISMKYDVMLSSNWQVDQSLKASKDFYFSKRTALQLHSKLGLSFKDKPSQYIGAGFTAFEARTRLRYEMEHFFAPYIGLDWNTSLGKSKDYEEAAGYDPTDFAVMLGILSWN